MIVFHELDFGGKKGSTEIGKESLSSHYDFIVSRRNAQFKKKEGSLQSHYGYPIGILQKGPASSCSEGKNIVSKNGVSEE